MYVVWVQVQVQADQDDRFREAIAVNAARSVAEETGCVSFDVIELDATEHRYAFYEVYVDERAFVVEHRRAAHYIMWSAAAAEMLVPGTQIIVAGDRVLSEPVTSGG